jgi:phosphate transport system substrate-binding protein
MNNKFSFLFFLLGLLVISCGGKKDLSIQNGSGSGSSQLIGAGATFPYPIYSKWFSEYNKINKEAKINYQSIGSGGGIKQITEGTVDFGASDSPMKDEEIKNAESKSGSKILQIPTVLGAVVIAYKLPGIDKPLNLGKDALVNIYMGKIKKWNDDAIKKTNPGVNLPDKDIIVVYRTDGSGTTFAFTDYLGSVSAEWKSNVGVAKDIKFPVGQGGKGNEGVAGLIKQLDYTIGYIELVYALQNNLQYANIENAEGQFIKADLDAVTKAAESMADQMPESMTMSVANAKGKDAYPVSSYTYILVYQNQRNKSKGRVLKDFLIWALNDGEKIAKNLGYAPLPESVRLKALEKVNSIN